ncbi:contractile injection system protein, VgrG/Pvc8 family, partial [Vibrio anguillarum]
NFTLKVDGLAEDVFVVRDYQGQESLSDTRQVNGEPCYGFRYHIELASRQSTLSAMDVVDKNAQLAVIRNGQVVQYVHGIVRHFGIGDTGHSHTHYSLTLVPALERLSL